MSLSDLTADGVRAAIAEFDERGREAFLAQYGFGEALTYFLLFEGRKYDSKAIAGVAHLHDTGDLLSSSEFTGGLSETVRHLKALGFEVTSESESPNTESAWQGILSFMAEDRERDDFDEQERDYKLQVASNLAEAISAARQNLDSWTAALKIGLGHPNNLSNWRSHTPLLGWAAIDDHASQLRDAIAQFGDPSIAPLIRFRDFAAAVEGSGLAPGDVLALGSLLNFAAAPAELPVVRARAFESVEAEVGIANASRGTALERYERHLEFADEVRQRCVEAGIPIRDMLDVQSLIFMSSGRLESSGDGAVEGASNEGQTAGPGGKYQPLADWLAAQDVDEVEASFSQIEGLVGGLPMSARKYPVFWTGTSIGSPTHVQKRAWESAGFNVAAYSFEEETVTFARMTDETVRLRAEKKAPRYWWVNQGKSYPREMPNGYVYAGVDGRADHRAVSDLEVDDFIVHYQKGFIRAIGRVREEPEIGPKPDAKTDEEAATDGRLARVEYSVLNEGKDLENIPKQWRVEEDGPFDVLGGIKQGYLYPLRAEFVLRLAGVFPEIAEVLGVDAVTSPDDENAPEVQLPYLEPSFDDIVQSIAAEGLILDKRVIRRFHVALRQRGFVILSGVSGTGKTWLAQAYARAVGGVQELQAVAPNWTTNEDLIGYLNPITGDYQHTPFSEFLLRASEEWARARRQDFEPRPYILILDEMNLARVEYYFALFLSKLEDLARYGKATLTLGNETVALPPNLKFVGTVNIDETTHEFADKVYDRAQLIELTVTRESLETHMDGAVHADELLAVWDAVHEVAPFAFRVSSEIGKYIEEAVAIGADWEEAFDEQLLQKVLPKIKGLDSRVGTALEAMVELSDPSYSLTHAKAVRMLELYRQHGTTSYFS